MKEEKTKKSVEKGRGYGLKPRASVSYDKKNRYTAQDRMLLLAILSLFTIFTILLYTLPEDVLIRYPLLRQGVDSIANVVPVISNLREYSTFPQLSATVYALGVLLWLALTIYFSIYLPFHKVITLNKLQLARNILIGICLVVLFMYLFFIQLPGNDFRPSTRRGRLILSMLDNRIIFASVSAAAFTIIASIISSTLMQIKIILRLFFKNNFFH